MNYAPDSTWVLDPRQSFAHDYPNNGFPMGTGNSVSVEFNLIYRWHSTVSARDEKWSADFFSELFPGKDHNSLSLREFLTVLAKWKAETVAQKPETRTFGGLKREASGAFNTKELATLLAESTQDVAGKYISHGFYYDIQINHQLQEPSVHVKFPPCSSYSKFSVSAKHAAGTSAHLMSYASS